MRILIANRRRLAASAAGFNLVEVTVAAVLLVLMAVALYGGFTQGFALLRLCMEDLRATQVLLRQMESIRLYTWEQVQNPAYLPRTFTTSYDPLAIGGNTGTVYHVQIDQPVVPPASSGIPESYRTNMVMVNVTVYWTNVYGPNNVIVRSRSMQTYVARYGAQNYYGF